MDFIMTIINILVNVCLDCNEHKLQCTCGCYSTSNAHNFECACGGKLNFHTNRECPNCRDYVIRDIDFNMITHFDLHQGQCQNCGYPASQGNNIRIGWCQKCRDIERVAEQNRLAGCPVDEDDYTKILTEDYLYELEQEKKQNEYEAKCQAQYAKQTRL